MLGVEQAAVYMSRTEKSVRHLISSGKLHNVSPDARVQVDRKEIDLMIERNWCHAT